MNKIKWKNELYELVGYSIIDFPQEFKDYPETIQQIVQNAEFFSIKYGVSYLDLYKSVEEFIEKYANTYESFANKDYLFKAGVFVRGTFVYKKIKNE
jgi:hypothetical protein